MSALLHFGPSGVSSISMPAALIRSRMASARPQSLSARAWARSSSRPVTSTSTAPRSCSASAPPPSRPRRVGGVEPEDGEHGPHRRGVAARRRRPSASSRLPSRTVSWMTATAAGVPRSSSMAATNGARGSRDRDPRRRAAARSRNDSIRWKRRRRLVERLEAELHVRAVVRADHVEAQLDAADPLEHRRDEQRVAERLAHLLAGGGDPGVVHPVGRERACPPRGTGPARSRGAGSAGRPRRRGCRRRRRGTCRPSPSTRCASPGGRGPRARARRRTRARWLLPALPEREVAGVALAARVGVLGGLHVVDAAAASARRTTATSARRSRRRRSRPRRRRRGPRSMRVSISSSISGTWPVAAGS